MVGTATTLRAGRSGVRVPVGARDLFFSKTSGLALGPPGLSLSVYRGYFLGLMWPGPEANYSPTGCQIKNQWRYTSTSRIYLYDVDRGNCCCCCCCCCCCYCPQVVSYLMLRNLVQENGSLARQWDKMGMDSILAFFCC